MLDLILRDHYLRVVVAAVSKFREIVGKGCVVHVEGPIVPDFSLFEWLQDSGVTPIMNDLVADLSQPVKVGDLDLEMRKIEPEALGELRP